MNPTYLDRNKHIFTCRYVITNAAAKISLIAYQDYCLYVITRLGANPAQLQLYKYCSCFGNCCLLKMQGQTC